MLKSFVLILMTMVAATPAFARHDCKKPLKKEFKLSSDRDLKLMQLEIVNRHDVEESMRDVLRTKPDVAAETAESLNTMPPNAVIYAYTWKVSHTRGDEQGPYFLIVDPKTCETTDEIVYQLPRPR